MSSIYDWSTIAANNGNSDGSINWAEGQAPSTVNNSARVMMQRIKELLNDLGGATVAGGSANVLTVTASSSFTAYADGIRVTFRAATDNTGSATLNVNAIGAKPLIKFTPAGETALAAGEIQGTGIYEAVYSTALNAAAGAWLLLNPTTRALSAGMIAPFGMSAVQSGWLECNGAAVSRTTYADLFSVIGTTWGAGNGSTTFTLPDFRGEFLRGWDHGRGIDASRTFASFQDEAFKSHTHTGSTNIGDGAHDHSITTNSGGSFSSGADFSTAKISGTQSTSFDPIQGGGAHIHDFTTNATGGTETRPRNRAVIFCIKT